MEELGYASMQELVTALGQPVDDSPLFFDFGVL